MGKRAAHTDAASPTGRRGSHRAPAGRTNRKAFAIGVVTVLVLVAGGYAALRYPGSAQQPAADEAGGCGATDATIATTRGMIGPLRTALRDQGCTNVFVEAREPGEVATALVSGSEVPDYWIPDSQVWVDRVARTTGATPVPVVASVASSPVVLAAASASIPRTWSEVLAADGLLLGDPLEDGSSAAPLLLATRGAANDAAVVAALAPQAQLKAAAAAAPKPELDRLQTIDTANAGYTTTSEQALVTSGRDLEASVPEAGTWLLTFPLVQTASGDRASELTDTTLMLKRLAVSPEFRGYLTSSHYRVPGGKPVAGGVGEVEIVDPPRTRALARILSAWTTLAVPSQTLAVIDVSGSMDFTTEEGSRIDLTVAATRAGMGLFPDGASVGLWAFSQLDDGSLGGDHDYREIVPIRRLDAYVAGRTQREELSSALDTLPALTDGGTGLYDTTLAAYRKMQADYDPTAVNSVLLFSDGANDDPGSGTLEDLVAELGRTADPDRPVSIITIGISDDADAAALGRIAEATGGFSIVARQPADMSALFQQAMAARFS